MSTPEDRADDHWTENGDAVPFDDRDYVSTGATTPVVGEADPVRAFVKRILVWRLSDYDKSTIKSAMFLTPHQVDFFEFELRKLLATVIPTPPPLTVNDLAEMIEETLIRHGVTEFNGTRDDAKAILAAMGRG